VDIKQKTKAKEHTLAKHIITYSYLWCLLCCVTETTSPCALVLITKVQVYAEEKKFVYSHRRHQVQGKRAECNTVLFFFVPPEYVIF